MRCPSATSETAVAHGRDAHRSSDFASRSDLRSADTPRVRGRAGARPSRRTTRPKRRDPPAFGGDRRALGVRRILDGIVVPVAPRALRDIALIARRHPRRIVETGLLPAVRRRCRDLRLRIAHDADLRPVRADDVCGEQEPRDIHGVLHLHGQDVASGLQSVAKLSGANFASVQVDRAEVVRAQRQLRGLRRGRQVERAAEEALAPLGRRKLVPPQPPRRAHRPFGLRRLRQQSRTFPDRPGNGSPETNAKDGAGRRHEKDSLHLDEIISKSPTPINGKTKKDSPQIRPNPRNILIPFTNLNLRETIPPPPHTASQVGPQRKTRNAADHLGLLVKPGASADKRGGQRNDENFSVHLIDSLHVHLSRSSSLDSH